MNAQQVNQPAKPPIPVVSTTGKVSKTSAGNQMSQLSLSTKINLDPQNQPPLSEDDWQTVPVLSQQSRYKRKKQNQSPSPEKDVPLTNRYSSLHVDDTSTIKSVPNLVGMKPKQPSKPPPIFLYGVEDLNQLTISIEEVVGQDDYSYKVVSKNQLILSSKTADIYKKLIEHIREKGLIGHTFTRKEDRSVKFFIKNLHHTTPKDVIIKAIEDTGNKVRGEVVNIRRRGTKEPYNIFIVNVEQNENNKLVKEIRYIFHQRVLIEDPRKSTIIPQCTRCQKYGHTKNNCMRPYKCVKCAEDHKTTECTKSNNTPAKCTLCEGEHPANYKGCNVYVEMMNRKTKRNTLKHTADKVKETVSRSSVPVSMEQNKNTTTMSYRDATVCLSAKETNPLSSSSSPAVDSTRPQPNIQIHQNHDDGNNIYSILMNTMNKQAEKIELLLNNMVILMNLLTTLVQKLP